MDWKSFKILSYISLYGILITAVFIWSGFSFYYNYKACAEYFPDKTIECFVGSKYRIDPK